MTETKEATRVDADPFVQRLRDARSRTGMSQERFAEAINTSRRNILRWEGGHHRPSHAYLVRIARLTNVELAWLVEGEAAAA